jgi:flagellar biosynthesis GTPase FlhF
VLATWTLLANNTAETAGTVGVTGGAVLAAKWLWDKYWEWRKTNRAERQEDREQRLKETKEERDQKLREAEKHESTVEKLLREALDRSEKLRLEEKADAAQQRKEDRQEVHDLRNRLGIVESKLNAEINRSQRIMAFLKYSQSLLKARGIDHEVYREHPTGDTDIHLPLGDNSATTPVPPGELKREP